VKLVAVVFATILYTITAASSGIHPLKWRIGKEALAKCLLNTIIGFHIYLTGYCKIFTCTVHKEYSMEGRFSCSSTTIHLKYAAQAFKSSGLCRLHRVHPV
jgi:hypothetical protein